VAEVTIAARGEPTKPEAAGRLGAKEKVLAVAAPMAVPTAVQSSEETVVELGAEDAPRPPIAGRARGLLKRTAPIAGEGAAKRPRSSPRKKLPKSPEVQSITPPDQAMQSPMMAESSTREEEQEAARESADKSKLYYP